MSNTLKLVLTDHWFEEIKSGRKTHEYRKATPFWTRRILSACGEKMTKDKPHYLHYHPSIQNLYVQFQKAYRKNPECMTFKVKALGWSCSGKYSDLCCAEPVFDIELGARIK